MSQNKHPNGLLPRGFEDLLFGEAEDEAAAIAVLMDVFGNAGYQRIKPPLLEFEESMLADGPGVALSDQTFRLMDKETGKMLALRSDITPQIARIVCSRLADVPRPLRLSYANDVVRMSGSQQRTLRQFCQVGCELIDDGSDANIDELVGLVVQGLQALDIQDITIDFALPSIFDAVLKAAGVENGAIDALRGKVSGEAGKAIDALNGLDLSEDALADVTALEAVLKGSVLKGLSDVQFTLDPLETKGFEYHQGIAFTVFAKGVNGELGRGGAYALNDDQVASGFTLYMDTIRKARK